MILVRDYRLGGRAWDRQVPGLLAADCQVSVALLSCLMLVDASTGLLIGLHHHNANQGEKFAESHTGLDHISFQVADRAALEAWIDRLDELNIGHTGIRRRPNGPYATVVFRDPDNNQLEFAAPMPTDGE